ncbi:MAG: hypothetical protein V2J25_03870 [Desulfatiglans sp.]|jgi:hypothetical protein|nr:hypothetical protein [Desulfatiglans sp.]
MRRVLMVVLSLFIMTSFLSACATSKVSVAPDKTVLSPALIKKPIIFNGSGYKPNEMVVIELLLPEGVKVKGLTPEEKKVGIATGKADEKGHFTAKVGAMAVLQTFFQVGWNTKTMKPDFKQARPLPPGKYVIEASGVESEKVSRTLLELLPPPKKTK